MALSKVHNMNIIAIPRTIPGLVVVPVNRDLFSAANCHLKFKLQQLRRIHKQRINKTFNDYSTDQFCEKDGAAC